MAFDNAQALIFTGSDVEKFLDGLSSNKVEINHDEVIDTLVLDDKAKIIAHIYKNEADLKRVENEYVSVRHLDKEGKQKHKDAGVLHN